MAIKWNIDLVRKFVEENGNGDELISDVYVNANKKLTYKCHICSKEYDAVWKSYHLGHRHMVCMAKIRGENNTFSYEYVKSCFEEVGCELISTEYCGNDFRLDVVCKNGHLYKTTFGKFRSGRGCNICGRISASEKQRFSFEYVRDFILNYGDGDELISTFYINNRQELDIKCNSCGKKYDTTFDGFRQGYRCNTCSRKRGRSKQIENILSDNYNFAILHPDLLLQWDWNKNEKNPYRLAPSSIISVWWICPKCGTSYQAKINARTCLNKSGCPNCKSSKGEKIIYNFFNDRKIKNIPQYKINNCKDKRSLPFDCACWVKDTLILIEYQGRFHYNWVEGFITKENMLIMQKHDQIKRDYCKNNNIKLIEIPYWEKNNIEQILIKELSLELNLEEGR